MRIMLIVFGRMEHNFDNLQSLPFVIRQHLPVHFYFLEASNVATKVLHKRFTDSLWLIISLALPSLPIVQSSKRLIIVTSNLFTFTCCSIFVEIFHILGHVSDQVCTSSETILLYLTYMI